MTLAILWPPNGANKIQVTFPKTTVHPQSFMPKNRMSLWIIGNLAFEGPLRVAMDLLNPAA